MFFLMVLLNFVNAFHSYIYGLALYADCNFYGRLLQGVSATLTITLGVAVAYKLFVAFNDLYKFSCLGTLPSQKEQN